MVSLPTSPNRPYRGRLAPSPTGWLHLGHARTFWVAQERARACGGTLVLRNEDLDAVRAKMEFVPAMLEDLRWFGFQWQEGPDCGGPFGPYNQSERRHLYEAAFHTLRDRGFVYPCSCSRRDILNALTAPHENDEGPVYPGTCRPSAPGGKDHRPVPPGDSHGGTGAASQTSEIVTLRRSPPVSKTPPKISWRFRVPDGEAIRFIDAQLGPQEFVAGRDFGDFVVWRHDDVPSYQLAVVVDDGAMQISEVVRGADLLLSTARQLLLYRALDLAPPAFCHCPLMTDASGVRLAKRHDALSLRAFRAQGATPESLRAGWTHG